MSEFHTISIEMEDQECLIKSLQEMGYTPVVNDVPKNLFGYRGDRRKQLAHIIIPRSQVGSASNDVGFERVDGKYVMHLSEYDQGAKTFDVNKLKQNYAKNKIYQFAQQNVGKYTLGNTSVAKDGSIKIQLRRV